MCRHRGAGRRRRLTGKAEDTGVCARGMPDEAVAACTRILALKSERSFRVQQPRPCLLVQWRLRRRDRDVDQAIQLNPKYAAAYATHGEAYEAKNDPDRAIADFDQALNLDPSLADAQRGARARAGVVRKAVQSRRTD
jgi:tetratricopeptide (TPR) repeat protein